MKFDAPLVHGKLIKRYKRFFADIECADGSIITAHCPNTGAMTGCAEPGFEAYASPSNNPKRKLKFTWEIAVNNHGHRIGINTHNANKLVEEAIVAHKIPAFTGYSSVKREVKYGEEKSRIDLFLSADGLPDCYVEVKSVTLLKDGIGLFPDAKTERGTKHLRELINVAKDGHRAVLFFCVQHTGITSVSAAKDIDPVYADTLEQAISAGVEVIAWGCEISEEKIELNQALNFNC